MDPTGGGAPRPPAAAAALGEGIALLFSRWTALQMAVDNGWGGPDSRCKEADFAAEVHDWFAAADPNELYIDDLEELLDDRLGVFFWTVAEDGSVAEVAEKLMVMHEECLAGNFSSVERLRASSPGASAVAQSRRVELVEWGRRVGNDGGGQAKVEVAGGGEERSLEAEG